MKLFTLLLLVTLFVSTLVARPVSLPKAGFFLPDSLKEVSFQFKTVGNLILLPVTFNDTVHLNLILDTGCRNVVLFGKHFSKHFVLHPEKKVQFSGLGAGKPVVGKLSLNNKVAIDAVVGEKIPVVVVPDQNLFRSYANVDGIIGYDIFIKFEVEINLARRLITFRPAFTSEIARGYEKISIRVVDSRPIINSTIYFPGKKGQLVDLMLDTGSSLGLLLKTSDIERFPGETRPRVLGRGLNGKIQGTNSIAKTLMLEQVEVRDVRAGIIYSPWHNYASVGMDILKDYSIVLNYCKSYAGFRKL